MTSSSETCYIETLEKSVKSVKNVNNKILC